MDIYKACYVYWIRRSTHTDIETEGYVGITYNIASRWREHQRLRGDTNLTKALKKYDDIVYEIVEKLENHTAAFLMEKNLRPDYYIGWNIAIGGSGGHPMTEEAKKKCGDVNRDIPKSVEHRQRLSVAQRGKLHSVESKKKMSESHKGQQHTEETKKKIGASSSKRLCKPIEINGVLYPSRKVAMSRLQIFTGRVSKMLEDGTAKYL